MEKRIIENEKEAFQVPEGYFEGFEERLMARIARQEEPKRKPAHRQLWINRISIAAGIIGVLMLVTTAIINTQNEIGEKTQQIITANADENDAYYDEINAELSNEEIEDALAQIEFNE
ncbi:MAG: hypothetical protein MJ001_07485 [Paludibacteraceae bacterium]|nr:hypothetical protein [Paludibacteraceae bacterium]